MSAAGPQGCVSPSTQGHPSLGLPLQEASSPTRAHESFVAGCTLQVPHFPSLQVSIPDPQFPRKLVSGSSMHRRLAPAAHPTGLAPPEPPVPLVGPLVASPLSTPTPVAASDPPSAPPWPASEPVVPAPTSGATLESVAMAASGTFPGAPPTVAVPKVVCGTQAPLSQVLPSGQFGSGRQLAASLRLTATVSPYPIVVRPDCVTSVLPALSTPAATTVIVSLEVVVRFCTKSSQCGEGTGGKSWLSVFLPGADTMILTVVSASAASASTETVSGDFLSVLAQPGAMAAAVTSRPANSDERRGRRTRVEGLRPPQLGCRSSSSAHLTLILDSSRFAPTRFKSNWCTSADG